METLEEMVEDVISKPKEDGEVVKALTESIKSYENRYSKLEEKNSKLEEFKDLFSKIAKVVCPNCNEQVKVEEFELHCKNGCEEKKQVRLKTDVHVKITGSRLLKNNSGMPYLVLN